MRMWLIVTAENFIFFSKQRPLKQADFALERSDCIFIFQIRFWKVDDPENTRKEVEIPRQPTVNNRIKRAVKDSAVVTGLYPFSHMQADIVARNTYYQSNGSDLIDIITPEGGRVITTFAEVKVLSCHSRYLSSHDVTSWSEIMPCNKID